VKKRGTFSIEKKYEAFNRGTLIRFLRSILHFLKKKRCVKSWVSFF
jgi:hypothetical protein